MFTVLAKVYRSSGRPSAFESTGKQGEIDRLVQGHQFVIIEQLVFQPSQDWMWDHYTHLVDGWIQWK